MVLGAILLLWSHIILLVALLLSMYRFSKFQLRIPKRTVVEPMVDDGGDEPSQNGGQAAAGAAVAAKTMEVPAAAAAPGPAPE